ncbi:family 43 glycosylhydrolase [Terriglobus roseus]|uniref:F5/8 type C domain-containing protein n=1 Tax=Terriglobus roseus TaxID=392734 RepID=A0A1H4L0E2_9BACT|nr:family 43 glycosylhydrolase [Terriglobus roseus]SEB64183.1 F5/8 type C domain-containing protein [Terriglobus roseus]
MLRVRSLFRLHLPSQLCFALLLFACQISAQQWNSPHDGNPFIPGYYADASVVQTAEETYVFATEDPWGGDHLGCWRSTDFAMWKSCTLNWPTKQAAVSATANGNKVWAPSVIRAKNGRYYMYVSIGSEVWVGTADRPLGPWRNALGSRPLIPATFHRAYNMIDAEVFQDTDGTAYLYWGSGLHWVNGHCFAVRLKPDMITFDGEPQDVTPPSYFEGPFMYKHAGLYYLMYSQGKATDSTYNVRYSIGDTPFGPFREGRNSPLLSTDEAQQILGPGHHAIFDRAGKTYILYHRHSLPFDAKIVRRQLCIDELQFDADGEIRRITPTHTGPTLLRVARKTKEALGADVTASSSLDELHHASASVDDNYATRWLPATDDHAPWLQLNLRRTTQPHRLEIRFEYPEKTYAFRLQSSLDGKIWADITTGVTHQSGSPVVMDHLPKSRYLRMSFPEPSSEPVSIFEWNVF